jgi:hypothetical protein
MINWRRVALVARFEWQEALGSRLALWVFGLYAVGVAIASFAFEKILGGLEQGVREHLAQTLGGDPASLPSDLVRRELMPMLGQFIGDESVKNQLLHMDPLTIFYAYATLKCVPLLAFATAPSTVADDVARGTSRFVLLRCDRTSWAGGKLCGQAGLLAVALSRGALAAGCVGLGVQSNFPASAWVWLARTSFRTFVYGFAYLGLFLAVSLTSGTRRSARARSLALVVLLGLAHSVLDTELMQDSFVLAKWLIWLFPSQYEARLWSSNWGEYGLAAAALFAIGLAWFSGALALFQRRDA